MAAPSLANGGMGSLFNEQTGKVRFRVWAPNASWVEVVMDHPKVGTTFELAREKGSANWSVDDVQAIANCRYQYRITTAEGPDNDTSEPHMRTDARALQVEGSDPSRQGYVVAPSIFTRSRAPFQTPAFQNFLIYQLHVGSFTGKNDGSASGLMTSTFTALAERLAYIKNLNFNAIQLLPISDFRADVNGGAGMGYGSSDLFASENLYATKPECAVEELVALIDGAHREGIAVILDVIYNHAGTQNDRYWRYDGNCSGDGDLAGGIYHVHGHPTQWGAGFAVWQQEVKDLLLDNARMYLRDYRVDGLRFDAVQAIDPNAVAEIVWQLQREFPEKYLIAEYNPLDTSTSVAPARDAFKDLGFRAKWDMSSADAAFQALDGKETLNRLRSLIDRFGDPNPWHSVAYLLGSHDQVYGGMNDNGIYFTERFGGRENGWARAKARLAWTLNVTMPCTPMFFMGTEGHFEGFWDPYVSQGYDHRFDWKLVGDPTGAPMQQLVTDANELRWNHPAFRSGKGLVVHEDAQNNVIAFKRWDDAGDVLLVVVNTSDRQWAEGNYAVNLKGDDGLWKEIFNSQAPVYGGRGTVGNAEMGLRAASGWLTVKLSSWSVHVFRKQ